MSRLDMVDFKKLLEDNRREFAAEVEKLRAEGLTEPQAHAMARLQIQERRDARHEALWGDAAISRRRG